MVSWYIRLLVLLGQVAYFQLWSETETAQKTGIIKSIKDYSFAPYPYPWP